MYCIKQPVTFYQRISLRVAYCLFVILFSLLGLNLFREWIGTNSYHAFFASVIAGGLLSLLFIRLLGPYFPAARLRWGFFYLISAGAILFAYITPLPITTVMMDVVHIPRSMEFFLHHHDNETRDKWRYVYKTRGDSHTMVSFLLYKPIRGHDEDLRIYMGYNPFRVHFGRLPPPVEIDKLEFGTDVLSYPLAFTVYKNRKLAPETGVIKGSQVAVFTGNRIRAPKISVIWDEDRVRKDSKPVRIALIKLLWIALSLGLSITILWSGYWLSKTKSIGAEVERYLIDEPE